MSTAKGPVFTSTTLPTGAPAVLYEGYGRHFFWAMQQARGDANLLLKYLLVALLEVDGKALTEEDVDALHIRDVSFAAEVLNSMMTNGVPGLAGM